jgi:hypothetical protein
VVSSVVEVDESSVVELVVEGSVVVGLTTW